MYWKTDRQKRKEFDQAVQDRKAAEKRDAWVRELEARDEEDREIRAAREARRNGARPTPEMDKAAKKLKADAEKLEGDAAEMQLGVTSSASENGQNKGILGTVQGWVWGSKK